VDFLKAVDEFKRGTRRPFPAYTDVLEVLVRLGYRRVAPVGEFVLTKARSALRDAAADALRQAGDNGVAASKACDETCNDVRTGLDRRSAARRGDARRLADEATAGSGINAEQLAFIKAIDEYKR